MADATLAMSLSGRLRNLPLAPWRALVPLFEAIINSVHAINERNRGDGQIDIHILRSGGQRVLALEGGRPRGEVSGFRITDNGVGFTDANFASFNTADSPRKLKIGGRGVGRLTWLKVFNRVRIRSTYKGKDGSFWIREFPFTVEDGVPPVAPKKVDGTAYEGTEIVLEDIEEEYLKHVPKTQRTIAERIVDHFLVSLRSAPAKVVVHDGDATPIDVTAEVKMVLKTAAANKVTVRGTQFTMTHVRITAPDVRAHRIAYLGNEREVRTENLTTYVPSAKMRLDDGEGGSFWLLTMVESELLDDSLTNDRSGFTFPDSVDDLFPEEWSLTKVRNAVLPKIKKHLEPFLAGIRKQTRDAVRRYVEDQAPEYRPLLKYRADEIDDLPTDLTPLEMELELKRIAFGMEMEQREEGKRLIEEGITDADAYQKYLEEVSDTARSNLAKYVIHRRVILNLFKKGLELRADDGKYELESAVHKIIFPLKKDSDEVPIDQTNLWIIDEKLAYHAYLASDKPFRDHKNLENDSKQRPDLIVYNRALAFVDADPPYQSMVIVEFKRAGRNDYKDNDNPFLQVYRYVSEVRQGKVRDEKGRTIELRKDVPFFAYIVCDITTKLREMAALAQLRPTWDGQGFFGFNETYGVYVEVVSFNKVLGDAERRNRVFFEKLRLK